MDFQMEIAEVLGKVMYNSRPSIVKTNKNPKQPHEYFKDQYVITESPSEII